MNTHTTSVPSTFHSYFILMSHSTSNSKPTSTCCATNIINWCNLIIYIDYQMFYGCSTGCYCPIRISRYANFDIFINTTSTSKLPTLAPPLPRPLHVHFRPFYCRRRYHLPFFADWTLQEFNQHGRFHNNQTTRNMETKFISIFLVVWLLWIRPSFVIWQLIHQLTIRHPVINTGFLNLSFFFQVVYAIIVHIPKFTFPQLANNFFVVIFT